MAMRRAPPKSRSVNSLAPPSSNPPSRPRSQLGKPNGAALSRVASPPAPGFESIISASASSVTLPDDVAGKRSQNAQHAQHCQEANIEVVIRCRRRSEREIQEHSPIIVSSSGPRSQQITIEAAAPTSTLGVVTLPPTRTYPFDMVFGPEADQSMVYQDVVHPMLEEVLKGYNCTLFAYGQTGTGKTYTMQGDVSLTPLGNPSAQAGMIPRVLFKMFHELESSGADYSVKISFVELYNEELRDLLAPELSAPAGAAQPMGLGAPKDSQGGMLKIFDDSSKKGIFIQGLEETSVKDFSDALALLAKGSQRRQIAATKFNDHSSRSHSVFSITVHSKETSSLGDDLLKVGKLNLVDLAGSENIGRSGAENKRAREAGMINQSLLTLGRVINALVDQSSHVPYRESKLTRLLQDSLGGRTKTCIIATVSPARSNMEETLSTLDYAIRAKSIRNKPEINQRMTRNALLKEYVAEIERLKSDLLAAREKNGMYFSEDTWSQLTLEQELRQTELEEARKQIDIIESQMRSVREEFEQSVALLLKTDGELKQTTKKLHERDEQLQLCEGELRGVKIALEEEVIVRKAHATSEDVLDSVASSLKRVVEESTGDVAGLFLKLERKAAEFLSSSKAVTGRGKILDSESRSFLAALGEFRKASAEHAAKNVASSETFFKKERAALASHRQVIEEHMLRLQSALEALAGSEETSELNLNSIQSTVAAVQERLRDELQSWSDTIINKLGSIRDQGEESSARNLTVAEVAIDAIGLVLDRVVQEARVFINNERKSSEQQAILVSSMADEEIKRLREENEDLTMLLESQRQESIVARDELVKRVSTMLVNFSEERDRGLREVVLGVQAKNEHRVANIASTSTEHGALSSAAVELGHTWGKSLEGAAVDGSNARKSANDGIRAAESSVRGALSTAYNTTTASIRKHTEVAKQQVDSLSTCSKVLVQERKIKKARTGNTKQLGDDVQASFASSHDMIASTSQILQEHAKYSDTETSALQKRMNAFVSSAESHVSTLREHTHLLTEHATRQNPPTGTTPRKRQWQYVDKWERTQERDDILREHRGRRGVVSPKTFNSIRLPGLVDESMPLSPTAEDEDMKVESDVQSNPLSSSESLSDGSLEDRPSVPRSHSTVAPLKSVPLRPLLQERSTNIMDTRAPRRKR